VRGAFSFSEKVFSPPCAAVPVEVKDITIKQRNMTAHIILKTIPIVLMAFSCIIISPLENYSDQ